MSGFAKNPIRLSALGNGEDDDVLAQSGSTERGNTWGIAEESSSASKQLVASSTQQKPSVPSDNGASRSDRNEKAAAMRASKHTEEDLNELSQLIDSFEGRRSAAMAAKPKRPTSPPKVSKPAVFKRPTSGISTFKSRR